jgi:hypothetical protein
MQKKYFLFFAFFIVQQFAFAQSKVVFNNNVSFTVPADWYIKDSSVTKITLRKNGDEYSKIEIKIYEHKEKDLAKYLTLDKKKFMPDPHVRTVLPDANLGGKIYKKVKYFTKNGVLKVNTDLEYVAMLKPKYPIAKWAMARLEVILTYAQAQEAAMVKVSDGLVAGVKF